MWWCARTRSAFRTYGIGRRLVQHLAAAAAVLCVAAASPQGTVAVAAERPVKVVALGDSLMAGYQLPASAAFPAQLEKALKDKGHAVEIANAGVSGDTSSGGLARVDWSVPEGTEAVILGLGANDMLRGIDPELTRKALTEIIRKLKARGIEVLLCGMLAAPNFGEDYAKAFNRIYPEIAKAEGVLFDPFFLEGVAADPKLNLRDGIHPSAAGVTAIAGRILPKAEELLARVRAKRGS